MKHTKLPWKAFKISMNSMEVRGKRGNTICEIINNNSTTTTPLMEDNAAFIAHAANCHEVLIKACKGLVEHCGIPPGFEPVSNHEHLKHIAFCDALAAIAKAEGRT